ncbi:TetR/AcrR family transcriptional regulator [Nocardia sp. NPDC057668]|uniref:TetR/AcrR family transcriptional regulator n=1 Tax=Nocardia sp. NPDC057668 TaxID=3346202 RepID=UPI00366F1FB9
MSRSYAGQTAADRAADRRARLIDVAFELVGTHGVSALGMRAVCRTAGLSQKFFYESFPDTDALLHTVYRAALTRLEHAVAPAAGDLRATFEAAAELMESDPRVCRILLIEPIADARLRTHVRDTVPALTRAALGDRVTGSPDDPATRMRFSTLFGALISLFIEWTEGSLGADRAAFADHATRVVVLLLGDGLIDATVPEVRIGPGTRPN